MRVTSSDRLILSCARTFLGTATPEDAAAIAAGTSAAREVEERAEALGLGGVVSTVAPGIVRPLHHRVFRHNACALATADEVGTELARRGVRAVALKGLALLFTVYRARLGVRPLSDIDLLVEPHQRAAAEAALGSLGFRSYGFFHRRGEVDVDLHVDLLGADLFPTRRLASRFDPERLWGQVERTASGVAGLLLLSPEHQLLHQAVHAMRHSYRRWIWLVDLALLLPRVDPDRLASAAALTGTTAPLGYALHLVDALLRVEAPGRLGERLRQIGRMEAWFLSAMMGGGNVRCGEALGVLSVDGVRDRVAYLREVCFPGKVVLRRYYPRVPDASLRRHRFGVLLLRLSALCRPALAMLARR